MQAEEGREELEKSIEELKKKKIFLENRVDIYLSSIYFIVYVNLLIFSIKKRKLNLKIIWIRLSKVSKK